jgi:hypothetical protein
MDQHEAVPRGLRRLVARSQPELGGQRWTCSAKKARTRCQESAAAVGSNPRGQSLSA